MKPALLCALLLLCVLPSLPAAAAAQEERYVAVNPWSRTEPECRTTPLPVSARMGGDCFQITEGPETRFRVAIRDEVKGPGFGAISFCHEQDGARVCELFDVCGGATEGLIPVRAWSVSVVVYDPVTALDRCGGDALGWVPTRGIITLAYFG